MSGISAAPGALVLLRRETVTAAVSAIDFVDLPIDAYAAFEFHIEGLRPVTDGQALFARLRPEGGAFASGASDYRFSTTYARSEATGYGDFISGGGAAFLRLSNSTGNAAAEGIGGVVALSGAGLAGGYKYLIGDVLEYDGSGSVRRMNFGGGYVGGTGRIDGVRFYWQSGNIAAGTIRMYGRRG